MKHVLLIVLGAVLLLSACKATTGMEASQAWARPAMEGGNGAVYFLLQNHAAGSDELTGVSSDAAQAVEMHESKMEADVMQMRQVTSVPIEGKGSIQFAPGGYHVMLIGLNQELKAGDEIQVTLHFRENEDIVINVPVQEAAPGASAEDH